MFKILDLFSGAGGAAMGLQLALNASSVKHTIIGIDILVQDRYPFNRKCFDVTKLKQVDLEEFDFIWASPPCQKYSLLSYCTKKDYPDLIPSTRALLEQSGKPYVIENVEYAPLRNDLILCGEMFNLKVFKHRVFESNFELKQLEHKKHNGSVKNGDYITTAGNGNRGTLKDWQNALGIDWIRDKHLLAEAIPPAYSRYIMDQYLSCLNVV